MPDSACSFSIDAGWRIQPGQRDKYRNNAAGNIPDSTVIRRDDYDDRNHCGKFEHRCHDGLVRVDNNHDQHRHDRTDSSP